MRKFLLSLLLLVFMAPYAMRADEIIIGDGTDGTFYAPFNSYFAHSWTEMIYPASEIGGGYTFSSVEWNCTTVATGATITSDVYIYMGETTRSVHATTSEWTPEADLTLVYSGSSVVLGDDEWESFMLDTPFNYTGVNNLVVVVAKSIPDWNMSVKFAYTSSNNSVLRIGSDYYASYTQYPTGPGTLSSYLPNIKLVGAQIPAGPVTITPDPIDLGPRPNGYWMRPQVVKVTPMGGYSTLTAVETSNNFFQIEEHEYPMTLLAGEVLELDIVHGVGNGNINAEFVVTFEDARGAAVIDMTAFAYDPVTPDVWELAQPVTTFPYTDSPVNIYDNYLLPGDVVDGQDAVYKVTLTEDVLFTASVFGENAKVAIYTEDFNGEEGPKEDNYYKGIEVGTAQGGSAIADWLYYDNGTYNNAIGLNGGGSFYWAVMFPAADLQQYVGATLTKVSMFDYLAHDGEIGIFLGGDTAPANLMSYQDYLGTGSQTFVDYTLNTPVAIDGTQNLWIVAVCSPYATFPAAASVDTGDPNGRWCSVDGTEWMDIAAPTMLGEPLTWMLRGFVTDQTRGEVALKPIDFVNKATGGTLASVSPIENTRSNEGSEFSFGFETGMEGWTTINANADDHTWFHNSEAYQHSVLSADSHTGTGHLISESYCNATWTSIQPDDYVVAPEKVAVVDGSTFSFYACAQDENWAAEHFGVAVSTTGNTDAADFATIAEWTVGDRNAKATRGTRGTEWTKYVVDLSRYAGQEVWVAVRHFNCYDNFALLFDDALLTSTPQGDSEIRNMVVPAGTYYVAASATSDFDINIATRQIPLPEKPYNPTPADMAHGIFNPVLNWEFGEYTVEYQVLFGGQYPPTEVLIDWTDELAVGHVMNNLYHNTNYFWQVNVRNSSGTTYGDIWAFTTTFNIPQELTVADAELFEGEDAVLTWEAVLDRSHRGYNVYVDGVKVNEAPVVGTTYTIEGLTYNMDGYEINVTAVYDEGESDFSDPVMVYVSGLGAISGYTFEQDGTTIIAGVTVTIAGVDEFGDPQRYTFTTDANGFYSGEILAGEYNGLASMPHYQYAAVSDIVVVYGQTTENVNFNLYETYYPVFQVLAEEIDETLVKVIWSWNEIIPESIIVDFETGDFSQAEFNNEVTPNYPWVITETAYEGTYAMMSGCAGADNGVSTIELTVDVPYDGAMSFYHKISSESYFDAAYFYIDGVEQFNVSGEANWAYKEVPVSEGLHTYKWSYVKDYSVSSGDDTYYIDNISLFQEIPPFEGGWLYYDDGTYASCIGTGQPAPVYWAVSHPNTEEYAGYTITKLSVFDAADSGVAGSATATLMVAVGGTDAPGTIVTTQDVTFTGSGSFVEVELTTPVTVDPTQSLWIVAYCDELAYPAAGCAYIGNQNTDWISLDGMAWEHAAADYMLNYTWMLRAYLESGRGATAVLGNTTSTVDSRYPQYEALTFEGGASTGSFVANENATSVFVGTPANSSANRAAVDTRAIISYNIYKTSCIFDEEPVQIGTTWPDPDPDPDTIFADVHWGSTPNGVYKWGVSVNYAGNRSGFPLIEEGFEGGELPAGWSIVGTGTAQWMVATGSVYGGYVPFAGTYAAFAAGSSIGGEYAMITSPISLAGVDNASLSFNYIAPSWLGDINTLEVRIANDVNGTWETIWSSEGANVVTWQQVDIDLAQYAGQDVYFSFVNIDEFGYGVAIDDFAISIAAGDGSNPESDIVWSNCLDKDMFTTVDVTVSTNSGDSPAGTVVSLVNVTEADMGYDQEVELDNSGYYVWEGFRKGIYEVTVTKAGFESGVDAVVIEIWDETSLEYILEELALAAEGLYVSPTGWAMWDGQYIGGGNGGNGGGAGDTFEYSFEDGLEGWTTIDSNSDGHTWYHNSAAGDHGTLSTDSHTGTGHLMSESYCNATWMSIEPDDYLVSPEKVNIGAGSVLTFWACAQDANYPSEHFGVAVSTAGNTSAADFTTVAEWTIGGKGDRTQVRDAKDPTPWVQYTADLSAYAGQEAYIALRHFDCYDQFILLVDDVVLGTGAKGTRALERYTVLLDNVIESREVMTPFYQHDYITPGETYVTTVISNYTTGDSERAEYTWTCVACDEFEGATEFTGEYTGGNAVLSWTLPNGGQQGGEGGDSFNFSFENGDDGWTTINANGDDHTWYHNSEAGDHSVLSADSHTGTGHMMSESYCNATWMSMEPDDYLVSPEKYTIGTNAEFKFWACAQDANYPSEHFGVAISTAGNTSAADFTTVAEWTVGGKGDKTQVRDAKDPTPWVQYTVNLNEYAGQDVYIAVRHFDCYDQFILLLDDVELTAGEGNVNPPTPGESFSFETGLEGWTTIDSNSDGHTWYHNSDAGNHSVLSADSHTGTGHLMSESYCNATWMSMEPDDYIVSPSKIAVSAGTTVSFWACAQDANYPSEHFGVAVSTAGNTSAADFTTVAEWTVGGKGDRTQVRDAKDPTPWVQYTADLSAYAGQEVWVAIRHFDCYDQFILLVDDVEIGASKAGSRAAWDLLGTISLTTAAQQGIATDGANIYTCSWNSANTGGIDFFKYDMDGNFIESFNIAGATGVRDLTYDGQYFYGSSGASQIFILDMANKSLVGTINCSGLTSRHLSYDPEMDGFWSGNWETLALYDRNGAMITSAPAPTSAYGSGYFVDNSGNPHLYLFCQPASDAKVYDFDINANTINPSPVFDFVNCPGYDAGISGGAFIGQYDGKLAFFGNLQQDPNLVGIYEIEGQGNPEPPVPPTPNENILGVMVYRDGQLLTNEPITETTYTEIFPDEEAHEYCIRVVYAGEPDVTYYAMSCPQCITLEPAIACEAPADLYGEYTYNEDNTFGATLTWPYTAPVTPTSEWLYYDDGVNVDAIGGPASFYWGIKFTAESLTSYAGTFLTKVSMYDYTANSGGSIYIYQGGDNAPGTLVHTQPFEGTGSATFVEYDLTADIPVDETQPMWIVMSTVMGTSYPASCCNNTGNADGRWISTDGSTWEDLAGLGLSYTWMIRGFVTNESKGVVSELKAIEMEYEAGEGEFTSFGQPARAARELDHYNVYRSTSATSGYELVGETTEGTYFDAVTESGMYYYQVTAVYVEGDEECESAPANSYADPDVDYVAVNITAIGENGVEGMMVYPNPTMGDLNINAEAMTRITITNALGQVMYDQAVDTDSQIIDMAQYEAGVYMVRITTENGVAVERITVIR